MNYEQKYKEALERAREIHNEHKAQPFNIMIKVFPELAESEDEKIRKAIAYEIHCFEKNCEMKEKMLAWLEKQGQYKEINNFDVLPGLYKCVHRMFDGTPDGKLLFEVGNIYKCLSKHDRAEFEVSYGHSVYLEDPVVCKHFIPFENQGRKETTDKVEPKFHIGDRIIEKDLDECGSGTIKEIKNNKYYFTDGSYIDIQEQDLWQLVKESIEQTFKVGDWIVNNITKDVFLIESVNSGYCTLKDTKDDIYFPCLPFETDFHLWTIKDARDGDVLVNWNNTTFIFKAIEDETVKFHIAYNEKWNAIKTPSTKLSHLGLPEPQFEFHPATKEQREQLEKSMAGAGYEWNEKEKRLIEVPKIKEETGVLKQLIDEEKFNWSEEDEAKLKSILFHIEDVENKDVINWLKSLKDRVQPQLKQEWSKEDET